MVSKLSTVEFIIGNISASGKLSAKRMFGEYGPYPGAKPCFVIPEEKWGDSAWLSQLIALTYAQLPAAKKKVSKKPT
ncbi:hypothetical protein [Serratia nevei]|uniref:hypothetical protein n=1 Tax=Serratia nevei TaxID=2703794 RepID=UPI0011CA295C|nr:hypothetical protein [Serratia nevei]TXE74639.1 hypothetical protein FOT59_02720 [Serratia nevei]GJK49091.1 hypothetical protein TUM17560_14680 [Serratia marcescens]